MKTSKLFIVGIGICVLAGIWFYLKPKELHQMDSASLSPEAETSAQKKGSNQTQIVGNKITDSASGSTIPSGVAPAARNVAQASSSRKAESLDQFLKKLDPKADWRVNRTDTGRVTAISGSLIQGYSESPEKLQEFAQQIAELTGVPGQQVVPSSTKLEDTPQTEARQFDQEVDGYKVFGGYMKIFTRKSDGSIYYVANETRDVGGVDLRIKYSGTEASQIALQAYSDKKGVVVESVSSKPVIFPNQALGHGELAWEVIIHIDRPLIDRRHLLISASSGQILKDVSLIIH